MALIAVAALASAPASALAATADPAEAAEPAPGEASVLRSPGNPLQLTDAQRERIQEIMTESRTHADQIKAQLVDARADLNRKLNSAEPDFDEVMREADRVGALETQLKKHQLATLMSLRALLSPDQREGITRVFDIVSARERGLTRPGAGQRARATSDVDPAPAAAAPTAPDASTAPAPSTPPSAPRLD